MPYHTLHAGAARRLAIATLVAAAAMLAACGGGGGSSGTVANPLASARLSGEAVLQATTLFDVSGTSDPQGRPITGSWDYGDGSSGSANSHVYTRQGSFTATYTARNDAGGSASAAVNLVVAKCSKAGTSDAALSPYPTVCMQTALGELVVEVFPAQAPATAANFLKYVDDGFYSGTLFHRVIKDFIIQAGGFTAGLVPKSPTYPAIPLESNNGLKNWQYTLAMARVGGQPNSATSQFYINLKDNNFLDYGAGSGDGYGYAVFGKVITGTSVVDTIGAVATNASNDAPLQELVIRSAVRMP